MKKITLVLVLLLSCGLMAAMADDMKATFTVAGSATASIGFNLNSNAFGMTNTGSGTLAVTFVPVTTVATAAAEGWSGWVQLGSFSYYSSTAGAAPVWTNPTVTARIVKAPIWFQIWTMDTFTTGQVPNVENDTTSVVPTEDNETGHLAPNLADGTGGFTFAYDKAPITIKAHFATETGFGATDLQTDNNSFIFGVDGTIVVAPMTITLEAVKALNVDDVVDATYEDGLGIGAKVALGALGPLTSSWVGFDGYLGDPAAASPFAWEVGAGASMKFATGITAGLALVYSQTLFFDTELTFNVAVAPITVGLTVGVYDIGTAAPDVMDWRADLTAAFQATPTIKAGVNGGYDSFGDLPLTVYAELTMIPKTKFWVGYTSANLLASTTAGALAQDKGTIKASATITY